MSQYTRDEEQDNWTNQPRQTQQQPGQRSQQRPGQNPSSQQNRQQGQRPNVNEEGLSPRTQEQEQDEFAQTRRRDLDQAGGSSAL